MIVNLDQLIIADRQQAIPLEMIGEIISFIDFTEQISTASGIAIIIDRKDAVVILPSEYSRPGTSCPVCIRPTIADNTDSGDGTNNGVVIIDASCQIIIVIGNMRSFFMFFSLVSD